MSRFAKPESCPPGFDGQDSGAPDRRGRRPAGRRRHGRPGPGQGLAFFVAAMVMLGLAIGLMLTASLALMSLQTGDRGRRAGINGVAQALGMVAGQAFGAILYRQSTVTPYWTAAALLGAAAAGISHHSYQPPSLAKRGPPPNGSAMSDGAAVRSIARVRRS